MLGSSNYFLCDVSQPNCAIVAWAVVSLLRLITQFRCSCDFENKFLFSLLVLSTCPSSSPLQCKSFSSGFLPVCVPGAPLWNAVSLLMAAFGLSFSSPWVTGPPPEIGSLGDWSCFTTHLYFLFGVLSKPLR